MKLRNLLSLAALVAVTAIPAIGSAQVNTRRYSTYERGYYGNGPFYPSYTPGPSYQYFGTGAGLRIGGASVYFGTGGGYFGSYSNGYWGPSYYRNFGFGRYDGYRYRSHRRSWR